MSISSIYWEGFRLIKPKRLKCGDTIGVIAPSSPSYEEEKIEKGKKVLEEMGFKVKMGESCYKRYGYLAGEDDLRARDINAMFADKEVDGIICLRGGYGTPRILDKIDYNIVKNNPKVYVGYSDITTTHVVFNQICKLVTFHGPMVTSEIADGMDDFTEISLMNLITGQEVIKVHNPEDEEIKCLYEGKAEGQIVGGNLAMICSCLGTPYEIDTKGKLLFLEDIGEEVYRIDRLLTQLYHGGKLQEAKGIILGDWNDCTPEKPERSLTLMEVFKDIILPLKKPTIYNVKAGHCSPMMTLPLGVNALMDANKKKLVLKESAVL